MLAIEFSQVPPIAIAMLIAFCVLKLMKMKQQHRPRELFKDESSQIDLDLEAELQPLKPAMPAFSSNAVDRAEVVDAALQTKLGLLDQLLVEADREVGRLTELLHEIRSIRVPGVVSDHDFDDLSSPNADDGIAHSTGATDQAVKVDKQQFIRLLHQSGYSPDEVAKAVKLPLEIVLAILGTSGSEDRAAS